jgi:hypothetical protein
LLQSSIHGGDRARSQTANLLGSSAQAAIDKDRRRRYKALAPLQAWRGGATQGTMTLVPSRLTKVRGSRPRSHNRLSLSLSLSLSLKGTSDGGRITRSGD